MWIKVFLNDHSYVVVVNVLKSDQSYFRKMTDREDVIQLQSDINSLELWFEKWLVTLNTEKCHILTFWQISQHNAHTEMHSSKWRVRKLCWAKRSWICFRIWLDIRWLFIFKDQKSKHQVGLIPRLFSYFDSFLFKKLFSTYVRPHLHNDHVIWAPYLKKSIK